MHKSQKKTMIEIKGKNKPLTYGYSIEQGSNFASAFSED